MKALLMLVRLLNWVAVVSLTFVALLLPGQDHAFGKPGTFGVGIGIGGLSGISGYYQMDRKEFAQGLVSFSNLGGHIGITADYAVSHPDALQDLPAIRPYYGLGLIVEKYPRVHMVGRSQIRDELYLGMRIPLGIQIFVPETPLQFSFEIVPGMFLIPGSFVFVDTLMVVRFTF